MISSARILVAATTASVAAIGLTAGAGQAAASQVTFKGSCTFPLLAATTDKGIGGPAFTQVNANLGGAGTCTGTADGRRIDRTPSILDLDLAGRLSCLATDPDLRGGGSLKIAGATYPVTGRLVVTNSLFYTVELSGSSGTAVGNTISRFVEALLNPRSGTACLTGRTTEATLAPITIRTQGPLVLR